MTTESFPKSFMLIGHGYSGEIVLRNRGTGDLEDAEKIAKGIIDLHLEVWWVDIYSYEGPSVEYPWEEALSTIARDRRVSE